MSTMAWQVHFTRRRPLWLTEDGLPTTTAAWQAVFWDANRRCQRLGVRLRCNPHKLRHILSALCAFRDSSGEQTYRPLPSTQLLPPGCFSTTSGPRLMRSTLTRTNATQTPPHTASAERSRTLAWFIARRPGGVIAGAIQYRHQRVQLFEGTSQSGFRAEVEAEQALERGERLLAMVEGHAHQRLGGPAAQEAEARLEEFGRHAAFAGRVVTDPRRLQLIMRRHDPGVFSGEFVTCVFNYYKALCLRQQASQSGPALPDCKALACRNVALTDNNLVSCA